jgi:4-hydroxyphenylpyruvate dioxygenase
MPAPNDVYYERIDTRLPSTASRSTGSSGNGILIDGEGRRGGRLHQGAAAALRQDRDRPDLLRVHPAQGRRRDFGEGNFKALFESIEEDQIRRGVLKDKVA